MIEELGAIKKIIDGSSLTNLPPNKKAIDVKWIFKLKLKPNGDISKHKARIVARGFM